MKKILALAGDGIGPEIMESSLRVLKSLSEKYNFDVEIEHELFGGASIDVYGVPLRDELIHKLKNLKNGAVFLGAIGGPQWDSATVRPEQGLLQLRKLMGLYANIRPLKTNPILEDKSPLRKEVIRGTDLVIVRELTGGAYFGEPRVLEENHALDSITYTGEEIDRILRYAFELAMKRRKKVTSVDKANVLATSKLWRRRAELMANQYPEVKLEHMYVDAMAMALITQPSTFDVIVTENLFGDILSDEASVLGGSLGVLPSESRSKDGIALYEPAHGSAPDIAGRNMANPMAMIESLALMLENSFGRKDMAEELRDAVNKVLIHGHFTKDMNPENYLGTKEWTDQVIDCIEQETDKGLPC